MSEPGRSLLDILKKSGFEIYTPCGGKGRCGKCMVNVTGEGNVLSCSYFPSKDTEVILPAKYIANILVSQTKYLEDYPFRKPEISKTSKPYGLAIDIGTTTVVMYFLNLLSGSIEKVSSFLNPQSIYGADIISRINYCQEHKNGLKELQQIIVNAINNELDLFCLKKGIRYDSFEKIIVAGNTTMLHLLLGEDPVPIAIAPFRPKFTAKQVVSGSSSHLHIHPDAELITLPCISAYVGADIVAGLAVIRPFYRNYLFLDIGTNGEMALINGDQIYTCATAAGPAFEGACLSCGSGAVTGAISSFISPAKYSVIGNTEPKGICGSGIVDIMAYLLNTRMVDNTGSLKNSFTIYGNNNIEVTQEDIREIQLAKSAIYSGIQVLLKSSGMMYNDIDALFLAGGFGNYINIRSAIRIGLLPDDLEDRIYAVGNSAGIGALQYLKSDEFALKTDEIISRSEYIELSDSDDFTIEFVMNMEFE